MDLVSLHKNAVGEGSMLPKHMFVSVCVLVVVPLTVGCQALQVSFPCVV